MTSNENQKVQWLRVFIYSILLCIMYRMVADFFWGHYFGAKIAAVIFCIIYLAFLYFRVWSKQVPWSKSYGTKIGILIWIGLLPLVWAGTPFTLDDFLLRYIPYAYDWIYVIPTILFVPIYFFTRKDSTLPKRVLYACLWAAILGGIVPLGLINIFFGVACTIADCNFGLFF